MKLIFRDSREIDSFILCLVYEIERDLFGSVGGIFARVQRNVNLRSIWEM